MNWKCILREMKIGITETLKYILSHHEPEEYYKCYYLRIKKIKLYICSRCLGIYLGIFLGIIIYLSQYFNMNTYYFIIIFFPIFTLIDWTITAFTKYKSCNFYRTSFGILLGLAYSFGLILFFKTFPNYLIIFFGFLYIFISFLLILKQKK